MNPERAATGPDSRRTASLPLCVSEIVLFVKKSVQKVKQVVYSFTTRTAGETMCRGKTIPD